jgi:translation initiation factor IF-2
MPTGKVRIFELAKELGLSSKDLIGLFEKLGIQVKNQLSVVDDPIADLVRGVLLGGAPKPAPKPAAAGPAPETVSAAPAKPVRAPVRAKAPAPVEVVAEPVPTLKPVGSTPKRAAKTTPVETVTPPAVEPAVAAAAPAAPPEATPAEVAPPVQETARPAAVAAESAPDPAPASPAPRVVGSPAPRIVGSPLPRVAAAAPRPRPQAAPDNSPIPTLRPVPSGRSSVAAPRTQPPPQQAPNGVAASAMPGPQIGLPGRPGVAPRPGQPGVPGQGYRPIQNGQPGQIAPRPGVPGAPARRPAGNGPFRPLTPPAGGGPAPRPFTPRVPGAPGAPLQPGGPSPSSGGSRGPQPRGGDRDRAGAKKDRETEMLLEKERQRKKRGSLDAAPSTPPTVLETIEIPDVLTVQELATSMIIPAKDVIKELIKMGTMATINQNIPAQTAQNVARKFGFNAVIKEAGEEVVVEQEEDKPELLSLRPPVVTVLGHVDHGKTSLLDRIRSANVASGEAGGITQRIGAYTVEKGDHKLTFIDTPGHEAFTAMRARGAKVTDVAILVVAADDGVMPQTIEAISHIKAANVPIVVAINKMDREDAQPDRVKSQLAEQGLQPVDWGGKTEMVPVSARTGDGIDQLLETVLLEAELRELKANKNRRATGVVIESALDKGRGAVATVLVQNGTLRVGDVVVVGSAFGKIRALVDDKGKQVKKAGPSIPVEIMGLSDVPSAGDTLMVVSDERVAREAAAKRSTRRKDVAIAASSGPRVSLETFMSTPADGGKKTLNLILKADGQGAVEALRGRVESLSTLEVDVRVIYAGVGAITPNDVNLASASNAVLIGFNIRPDETVKRLADNEQVDLRFYQVIYDVENDLKKAMLGMLAPKFREVILGRAEVREVFKVSKVGTIAGCYVQSGKLTRNAKVRILRDSAVIFESELESLRRFKDDVREVAENFECGVQIAKFSDLKQGDVIEAFTSELVAPEVVTA